MKSMKSLKTLYVLNTTTTLREDISLVSGKALRLSLLPNVY
jgi:hypothetical protein